MDFTTSSSIESTTYTYTRANNVYYIAFDVWTGNVNTTATATINWIK